MMIKVTIKQLINVMIKDLTRMMGVVMLFDAVTKSRIGGSAEPADESDSTAGRPLLLQSIAPTMEIVDLVLSASSYSVLTHCTHVASH